MNEQRKGFARGVNIKNDTLNITNDTKE